ncbi:spore coat protein [Desulfosporosinus fructosivorans]|uniref:Spore coat protein n=1 Tax=Desulfosporosinus fructosivorans TaxID=2018669 RepID=A0A4Z0RC98_9FIRM|nr:spore coat protein [Desulfosporosinus fructosivorans]
MLEVFVDYISLGDQEIASDMLKDSRFSLISLGRAVTEATNPQLKGLILSNLLTAVEQHHQLSDLASQKDWYKPLLTPQQQVRK